MTSIGVQGYTLRNRFAELGITETFRRVAAIGYRSIEISAVPMTAENVAEIAAASAEHGVAVDATSAGLTAPDGHALTQDPEGVAQAAVTLGAEFVRIGMFGPEAYENADTLREAARRAEAAAPVLADRGVTLCFHNHAIEFARVDGTRVLDLILETAPSLRLELDVHWIFRGGLDPVTTLRHYGDRVALVHLKDYRVALPSAQAYEKLRAGDPGPVREALFTPQFAEVGEGSLAMADVVRTAVEIGAAHCFVEQDATYERDEFDAVALSYRHLTELGFGDLLTRA
ncbi:MAG TPA: sugar phosphate isomerase/epimerase [Actinotalea caeni]|uniref:sugar phosphate isomerase/epimerase family protein n=1 Tax=Actinotalea caeni TaxID=1348467 RepID=UPI002B4B0536|nr:sugar phosphate isomerase/epimerase [Actinotalea caeni]HLV56121.1 sugar phosphate isomerase/epimerase [Actinotalea caeni]